MTDRTDVTDAMIEAGLQAYLAEGPFYAEGPKVISRKARLKAAFLAMLTAQPQSGEVDHISKLEGERDRLREAFESIEQLVVDAFAGEVGAAQALDAISDVAQAALNGSPPSDNKGKNDG